MKKQVYNPFLPLDTYIPDGEPHVFGDRVYLFGSHDKEGGNTFCMLPYEIWSAPVGDLSDWTSKGINYRAEQDPLAAKENAYMYAPDCVQGNDGRYYLYYCLSGYKGNGGYSGPIGVAVCDTPDGKYEFYGHVRNADGTPLKRFVPFDPAVINDYGTIRLYYGTWYPFDELPRFTRPIMRRVQAGMFERSRNIYYRIKQRERRLKAKYIRSGGRGISFTGMVSSKALLSAKSTDCIILYILPSTGMNSVMPPAAIRTGTLHTAALLFPTVTLVLTGARKRTESIIRPQITAVSKKLAVNGMCFITDRRTGAITVVRRVPSAYKFCPTAAFHRLKSRHADSTAAA